MATSAPPNEIPEKPYQPRNTIFPIREYGDEIKQYSSFHSDYFDSFKWLHYEASRDLVFCHPCMKAYKAGLFGEYLPYTSFISVGFCDWKQSTKPYLVHEADQFHTESLKYLKRNTGKRASKVNS